MHTVVAALVTALHIFLPLQHVNVRHKAGITQLARRRMQHSISNNKHSFAISRRNSPEVCVDCHPPKVQEGAGKAGCALHPRSRVQMLLAENAHEHTGSAEAIRPSLRNGFTAYNAISPVSRALLPPSLRRSSPPSLAPASGARTTRLRRPLEPRSSVATLASTASHRTFVTTRDPPLSSGETGGF
jgi:hypothetical protein